MFFWNNAPDSQLEGIGLTRDISVKGVFVFTATPPPADAKIELKGFLPPGGQALPVRMFGHGHVVRVEPGPGNVHSGFAITVGRIGFRKGAADS